MQQHLNPKKRTCFHLFRTSYLRTYLLPGRHLWYLRAPSRLLLKARGRVFTVSKATAVSKIRISIENMTLTGRSL